MQCRSASLLLSSSADCPVLLSPAACKFSQRAANVCPGGSALKQLCAGLVPHLRRSLTLGNCQQRICGLLDPAWLAGESSYRLQSCVSPCTRYAFCKTPASGALQAALPAESSNVQPSALSAALSRMHALSVDKRRQRTAAEGASVACRYSRVVLLRGTPMPRAT